VSGGGKGLDVLIIVPNLSEEERYSFAKVDFYRLTVMRGVAYSFAEFIFSFFRSVP